MKTRIIGLLIFLFVVIGAIFITSGVSIFINLPSLAFVMIAAAGLTLMRYRKGDDKLQVIKNLKRYLIFSGLIGTFIGFIQIAWNLESPNQLLPAIGVSLLTFFYALVFYCIVDTFTEHRPITA